MSWNRKPRPYWRGEAIAKTRQGGREHEARWGETRAHDRSGLGLRLAGAAERLVQRDQLVAGRVLGVGGRSARKGADGCLLAAAVAGDLNLGSPGCLKFGDE